MVKNKAKKWKCNTCNAQKNEKDPSLECDICEESTGLECTSYSQDTIDYLKKNKVEINFICNGCKETLPDLRNMLEITKQQQKLQTQIGEHDTRITKNEVQIDELKQKLTNKEIQMEQMNARLVKLEVKIIDTEEVETIAQRCFKSTDFPPMVEVRRDQEKTQKRLEEVIKSQAAAKDGVKRRDDLNNNLVIYGIPESDENGENNTEQMKADFLTIKDLYVNRVPISSNDLLQVTRLGLPKDNQIRPIKITFASMQKKQEVLRNNKNLILYGEEHDDECELQHCEEEENHKHIYVTTDKTKQQRAEEKQLREDLKVRKQTEPDLIIRNGKIIKKSVNRARWSELAQNGL